MIALVPSEHKEAWLQQCIYASTYVPTYVPQLKGENYTIYLAIHTTIYIQGGCKSGILEANHSQNCGLILFLPTYSHP